MDKLSCNCIYNSFVHNLSSLNSYNHFHLSEEFECIIGTYKPKNLNWQNCTKSQLGKISISKSKHGKNYHGVNSLNNKEKSCLYQNLPTTYHDQNQTASHQLFHSKHFSYLFLWKISLSIETTTTFLL